MRKVLFILIYLIANQLLCAQTWDPQISFSLSIGYGAVLANSDELGNSENNRVINLNASVHWQNTDQQTFNKYACFPKQTFSLLYLNFDNSFLGNGAAMAYSLAPYFLITNRLSLYPAISIGGTTLSNPYDAIKNPENKLYSLPISAYLAIGGGARFQLSKKWALQTSIDFNHISNGGWKDPNNGINWPQLKVDFEYSPSNLSLKKLKREINKEEHFKKIRADVSFFGLIRSGNIQNIETTAPVLGINFLVSKQLTRIHSFAIGVELYQDQLVQKQLAANNISSNGVRAGLLIGHEFLLNRFIFSQQLGVYLVGRNGAELLYHRWGLQYSLNSKISVGVNLRAYKAVAEFTDLRVSYCFLRKEN